MYLNNLSPAPPCVRFLGANLAIVKDVLPLHACLGMNIGVGKGGPVILTTHPLPALFSPSFHLPQNLKKSWHPQTLRNVEKVWKAEQKHEAERKKIEELQRELREERAREEMQRYAEDVGAVKYVRSDLAWGCLGVWELQNCLQVHHAVVA